MKTQSIPKNICVTTMHRAEATELAWSRLKSGEGATDFPVATIRLDFDAGYGHVRIGMGEDGAPQLLVPTTAGRRLAEDLSGEAVRIRNVQYVVDRRVVDFIEVRSLARELDDAFRGLVDEILRRLDGGSGPEMSVAEAVTDLRNLLKRDRSLDTSFLVGLFGELSLLERILALNPGASETWTGADSHRHDFSGVRVCIEAKSSLRRGSDIAHVSSIQQLEPPSDGRQLFLFYTGIELAGTGGLAVGSLIDRVRTMASSPDVIDAALDALELSQWRDVPALWQKRFAVIKSDGYRVEGDFPRIVATTFPSGRAPNGVGSVEYDIDLSHATRHKLDQQSFLHVLRDLASNE